ncbi:reverse transcriptase [Trichonephila clavipes]|nr:reverse transcriptase [Trichonephila clavipes]
MSGSISTLTAHTCQKQTEPARDGSVGCLRVHWPWGKNATNYDGEVLAVCEVATQLLSAGLASAKVVFFIDSQAAISALKTKQGAESFQPEVPLILRSARSIISTSIDKYTIANQKTKNLGKPWETLATVGSIPKHMERAEAVDRFRLTTGHEFLGVYLHWLGLAANEACPICGHARMDGDHLLHNALDSMNTQLTTSSGSSGRLGFKWSRSQAQALDK